ncbi:hypothetical protein LIER_26588 [Lithospermum erythrorhizon]|uniref:Uncharacterized protein n=1 Tax=Lithospermum erythrorhizon TaxID=34254 RepID=A0AAV3RCB8_LITER
MTNFIALYIGDYWVKGTQYVCYHCEKETTAVPRPLIVMMVTDETTTIKVVAIGKLAERILQTTSEDMSRLLKLGEAYDLDTIRSDFEGKVFLILLRCTYMKHNENRRRPLLLDFLVNVSHSSLSPLKRQMSEISLAPGSSAKKKLFFPESDDSEESSKSMA